MPVRLSRLGRETARGASLVRSAQAGSPAAIESLVRKYWGDAYRVGYLLTSDQGVSEDVAQETLLAALGSLESFDADRPFKPWLQRIAANKAHDWLRRRRRRPEVVVDSTVLEEGLAGDELDLEGPPLPTHLGAALDQLTSDFRAAVVLRHLLDMPAPEIADLLGIPEATVRTRLHRGLSQLEEILNRREVKVYDGAGHYKKSRFRSRSGPGSARLRSRSRGMRARLSRNEQGFRAFLDSVGWPQRASWRYWPHLPAETLPAERRTSSVSVIPLP